MNPIILFRTEISGDPDELASAEMWLDVAKYRSKVPKNSLVIGRYSVLPFYQELEQELALNGSKLINSYEQHQYIADVMQWAGPGQALDGITPKTWDHWHNLPKDKSFIVKGKTNSKKFSWNQRMFAETANDVSRIASSLMDDDLISNQGLVVREYVPFKKLMDGLNGLPITVEFRFFVAFGQVLSSGFYWSNYIEDIREQHGSIPNPSMVPKEFIQDAINRIKNRANFVVIDVGQLEDGSWMVVELNDGQMSGLSENNPHELYGNLKKAIDQNL